MSRHTLLQCHSHLSTLLHIIFIFCFIDAVLPRYKGVLTATPFHKQTKPTLSFLFVFLSFSFFVCGLSDLLIRISVFGAVSRGI
ncbi:hypothetical protein SLEP1_g12385 [Rubroshorea leprosula]|uniref:Uncharacterized protein n=1 Tax=Rubroshorea leprosula TaxID=152421 RepID=A0AAV5II28_9ROSI|nr:hypothetical protein SLEP1_g12385 [Rubroshorea leprosula]